jgi:hypothetical protein
MSKKDYIAIAKTIKAQAEGINARTDLSQEQTVAKMDTLEATARNLAQIFGEGNPRFDTARFLTACGF